MGQGGGGGGYGMQGNYGMNPAEVKYQIIETFSLKIVIYSIDGTLERIYLNCSCVNTKSKLK